MTCEVGFPRGSFVFEDKDQTPASRTLSNEMPPSILFFYQPGQMSTQDNFIPDPPFISDWRELSTQDIYKIIYYNVI